MPERWREWGTRRGNRAGGKNVFEHAQTHEKKQIPYQLCKNKNTGSGLLKN
jgi:hypothetical protein